MLEPIVVTTGIYDAIKDHVRRKRVTKQEETLLLEQLKHAKQVLRRDLPTDVVTVNRVITIKDHQDNTEQDYILVPTTKAKVKKNKHSILSEIALATVGYKVGDIIDYPFPSGERKIEILKVEPFEA